jgi:hypothetical protein
MSEQDELEHAHKLELQIQCEIVTFLKARDWLVERMLANAYQTGIPDLYCYRKTSGSRWIEIKRPKGYSFTRAQRQKFPEWSRQGVGIWILTAATQEQYDLLFKPPNWRDFWRPSFAVPTRVEVDAMIDELAREHEQSQTSEQEG